MAQWLLNSSFPFSNKTTSTFERQNYEYQLAKIAYLDPQDRYQALQKEGLAGTLVESLNQDEFFAVEFGDRVYNVHRGSKTSEDWLQTDTELALNRLEQTDRFKRSLEYSNQAERATGKKSVEIGHSLGGTLAEKIALQKGNESVVFNQGTTPLANYSGIDRNKNKHYRVAGDAISQSDPTATVVGRPSISNATMLQTVLISNVVPGRFQPALPWLFRTATSHTTSAFAGR